MRLAKKWKYKDKEDGIAITRYIGRKAFVRIPSEIKGRAVKSLESGSFDRCRAKGVFIPSSITELPLDVFDKCHELEEIIVDEKNADYESEDGALYVKTKWHLITVPNARREVRISDDTREMHWLQFIGCKKLTAINVGKNNRWYSCADGVLYSKNKDALEVVPRGIKGKFIISEGVKFIYDNAFACCDEITSISIPKSVTDISDCAFRGCKNLRSVIIKAKPKDIDHFGKDVFWRCKRLSRIAVYDVNAPVYKKAFKKWKKLLKPIE